MRKTAAIAFLLLYLSVNTELHQIFRLPVFFEHYQEHKQMNSGITMFRFIVLHYFSGDAKYGDYDRDQELPFKKNHCTEISISFVIPPDGVSEPVLKSFPILKNVVPSSQEFITSSFHFSIWQPPRA